MLPVSLACPLLIYRFNVYLLVSYADSCLITFQQSAFFVHISIEPAKFIIVTMSNVASVIISLSYNPRTTVVGNQAKRDVNIH